MTSTLLGTDRPDSATLSFGPPRLLRLASYAYVVIPAALQLAFWLRPSLALVAIIGWIVMARELGPAAEGRQNGSRGAFLLGGATVAVIAGAGNFVGASGDWRKHYAFLRDLTQNSWPLIYELPGGDGVASYSLGWYMPAATVGRVFGWSAANIALWAWLAVGIALVLWWAATLVGHKLGAVVVLVFSGLDAIGAMVMPLLTNYPASPEDTLETWPGEWQIPSVFRGLIEAPQHSIPTLVAVGLILSGSIRSLALPVQAAFLAALAVSSPFAVIAVAPFLLLIGLGRLRAPVHVWAGSLAFVGTATVFFLPQLGSPPPGVPDEVAFGLVFTNPQVPDAGLDGLLIGFVLVLVLEFLVFVGPVLKRPDLQLADLAPRHLVALSGCILATSLLFRVGHNNDPAMRVPGMAIFVMAILVAKVITSASTPRHARAALAIIVLIGSLTPLVEIRRNVMTTPRDGYSFSDPDKTLGLIGMADRWYSDRPSLLSQYLSDPDGPASLVYDLDE